jgi:formylglycine-generating enzyme required for sulfatase activity
VPFGRKPTDTSAGAMNRAALGRADFIRWAVSLDDARLGRLAQVLGYADLPEHAAEDAADSAGQSSLPLSAPAGEQPVTTRVRHRQYRVIARRVLAPPPAITEPQPPPEPASPVAPLGPAPPLIPWPRLWPFLRAALGELAERHRIDLRQVAAACARIQPLRRLPRLKGERWAVAGELILDLHPRLYPFWDDFNALKAALPRLRGGTGLRILRMDQGPDGLVHVWEAGTWGPPRPYTPPAAGQPVLIAGDLGCLGTPAQRQAWVRLGRRLAGSGRPPVVLTPCPPRWWDPTLAGLYFPVFLDRGAQIPPRPAGPRPWPAWAVDFEQAIRDDQGAHRLLALLSACVAIRPVLLRQLRHRLPVGLADTGSEAAAWQHPAFVAGDFALLPGAPEAVEQLRRAFPETGDEAQRRLAWELIRAQQQAGARQSDCMEERILHAAMLGLTDPAAEIFLDQVAKALDHAGRPDDAERAGYLAAWVNRRAARMHQDAWRYSPRSEALWLKVNPRALEEGATLPLGFDIHRALAAAGTSRKRQDWRLMQRGDWLEWEPAAAPAGAIVSGSPVIAEMPTGRPVIAVQEQRAGAPWMSLGLDPAAGGAGALPLGEHGWRLRTDFEELLITLMERPPWAQTLGRDQDGLFVGVAAGQGERRASWCTPLEWLRWPGLPVGPAVDSPWDGHGAFVDADQFKALRSFGLVPAGAGWTLSRDRYGLRAEISIKGVAIGLRWIWPGVFQMGSPPTEQGRDSDETQHEVILTRGVWLAETACTQALWEAVMDKNPSYTKGPQLPVEQVSWEDIQVFIGRLNTWLGGSVERSARPTQGFRLPTEAEWEYVCRAGTTTAYSFGDVFDSKLANIGSKTVAVCSLPPNPWGLYEMHGNVDEWCQDWFGDYSAGPVIDPAGADSGDRRVRRGGGWVYRAHSLRSACRFHGAPGFRGHYCGFRLALGPEPGQAGNGQPVGSGAGLPAQGASGSDRKARAVRPRGGKGSTKT